MRPSGRALLGCTLLFVCTILLHATLFARPGYKHGSYSRNSTPALSKALDGPNKISFDSHLSRTGRSLKNGLGNSGLGGIIFAAMIVLFILFVSFAVWNDRILACCRTEEQRAYAVERLKPRFVQTAQQRAIQLQHWTAFPVDNPDGTSTMAAIPPPPPLPEFAIAPSTGKLLQVHVAVNQIVEEDDLLVTLKPRVADAAPLDVTAPAPGRIIELSAAPGRRVAENAWLAAISDN